MITESIKICIISLSAYQYFNPAVDTGGGGAQLQLYYFATELAKDNNFQVTFITGDFGQADGEVREGVRLKKLKPATGIKFLRTANYFFRFWKLLTSIDADVYVQRAIGVEIFVVGLFCNVVGKKFIYMVAHDEDVMNKKPSWMNKGAWASLWWRLFRIGLKSADVVFTQNQRQAKDLKRYYRKDSVVRKSAHRIPKEFNDGEKENYVLWVARCVSFKRPDIAIELAKNMVDVKFIMICPVSDHPDFFKTIRGAAAGVKNLHFIDRLPPNAYDEYFRKARVHINTSRVEGFPNTYIQALKYKTPIISLNVNPDGILTLHDVGRCADGDVRRFEKYVREIMADNDGWKRLSENAYRYAQSDHDIRKIINDDKKNIFSMIHERGII